MLPKENPSQQPAIPFTLGFSGEIKRQQTALSCDMEERAVYIEDTTTPLKHFFSAEMVRDSNNTVIFKYGRIGWKGKEPHPDIDLRSLTEQSLNYLNQQGNTIDSVQIEWPEDPDLVRADDYFAYVAELGHKERPTEDDKKTAAKKTDQGKILVDLGFTQVDEIVDTLMPYGNTHVVMTTFRKPKSA